MKRLLLFDWLRGPDSTGMAVRNKHTNDASIVKIASHPLDLFELKKFTQLLSCYATDVFLGHNRFATKGKVNGLNAHPFECGHIVGAHNGTLTVDSWTELDKLCGQDTEVDSKAIFLSIEKHGIDATMEHMSGAWALVWINLEDKTINFLRNKERTLWYAQTEDMTKLLWASEWPMINCATEMSDKGYKLREDQDGGAFFPFAEDTLYTWDLEAFNSPTASCKPTVRTLKGKEVPKAPVTNFTDNRSTSGTPSTSTTTARGEMTQITLQGNMTDPFAGIIAENKFKELAQQGCSFCGSPINFDDTGLTVFIDTEQILGGCCTAHRADTRIIMNSEDFGFIKQAI